MQFTKRNKSQIKIICNTSNLITF